MLIVKRISKSHYLLYHKKRQRKQTKHLSSTCLNNSLTTESGGHYTALHQNNTIKFAALLIDTYVIIIIHTRATEVNKYLLIAKAIFHILPGSNLQLWQNNFCSFKRSAVKSC